jgi:hypothetical protein
MEPGIFVRTQISAFAFWCFAHLTSYLWPGAPYETNLERQ